MRASSAILFSVLTLVPLGTSFPVVAHDRTDRRHKPRFLAAADVIELASMRVSEGWVVRAMVLDSGRATSIVLESLSPRGRIEQQLDIESLVLDGRPLRMDLVELVSDLRLTPQELHFDATINHRFVDCRVQLQRSNGMPRVNVAQCQTDWNDGPDQRPPPMPGRPPEPRPPVPVLPPRAQWSRLPSVIQACGDAFSGQQNELACLDKVNDFPNDPTNAIRACEAYTSGDANAMACLGSIDLVIGDATPLIQSCEAYTSGDANMLRCTSEVRQLRFPMSEVGQVIGACEAATSGDDNLMRCLGALRGGRANTATTLQLIRTCEQAMSGDDATISCIGRGR